VLALLRSSLRIGSSVRYDFQDLFGGVEDVLHPQLVTAAHRSTDSLRICRSRSLSPPRTQHRPNVQRSSSSSLVICRRSKSELSRSKSTSRSISLSGPSSPRATEASGGCHAPRAPTRRPHTANRRRGGVGPHLVGGASHTRSRHVIPERPCGALSLPASGPEEQRVPASERLGP
jgi:hypothetical protein